MSALGGKLTLLDQLGSSVRRVGAKNLFVALSEVRMHIPCSFSGRTGGSLPLLLRPALDVG
jgi:hypothetical protein